MGFGSFASHIFEHPLFDVLQGHIDVAGDFGKAGDGGDEFIRPVGRVGVEEADPEIPPLLRRGLRGDRLDFLLGRS